MDASLFLAGTDKPFNLKTTIQQFPHRHEGRPPIEHPLVIEANADESNLHTAAIKNNRTISCAPSTQG